jgi:Ran GTPase-activating protein (RanGAP) involved in mRNA processing and transport
VQHLAGLASLERLDIDENPITDAAIDVIARLTHLKLLDLKDTRITHGGLLRLKKALPETRIRAP